MEFTATSSKSKKRRRNREMVNDHFLFLIDQPLSLPDFIFRAILWVFFVTSSLKMIVSPLDYLVVSGFWHNVNLPFHEAGHVLFGFLPPIGVSFMGTGMQLLMPVICGIALLVKTVDSFGASVTLWWFGENLLDIAPYVADARSGTLPLLGGNTGQDSPYGFHDWQFILTECHIQKFDIVIGTALWNCGKFIMIAALLWGVIILWRSFSTREWR